MFFCVWSGIFFSIEEGKIFCEELLHWNSSQEKWLFFGYLDIPNFKSALLISKGLNNQATISPNFWLLQLPPLPTALLPLVILRVLSPLATKSYSATKRLGSFSLGPARRFSLEFQRAASLRPWGSKSDATGLWRASGREIGNRINLKK